MNRKERRKNKKLVSQNINDDQELLASIQLHTQKQYDKAEEIYLRVISKDPKNYQALRHLGILYHDKKQYDQAISYLDKAILINSLLPDAHNNLGLVYFVNDKLELAKKSFEQSFLLNNSYLPAVNNLTRVYFSMGDSEKCMQSAIKAAELKPGDYISDLNFALALSINGRITEGIKKLEELKKLNKTDDLFNQLALMYEVSGNIEKSNKYLMESFKLNQNNYAMLVKLMETNVFDEKKLNYKLEERYSENKFITLIEKSNLARCLYISNYKKNNFKLAGEYLIKSNELRDEYLQYNVDNDEYLVNKLISCFNKDTLNTSSNSKLKSSININPIFIVGMPRSGTTLAEQILASHSEVHGGGELDYVRNSLEIQGLFDISPETTDKMISKINNYKDEDWIEVGLKYLDRVSRINNKKKYVTDKMPHNFMMCGIIQKMLPHAKIIYCYRDSMDNCFSLYRNTFAKSGHGYSYDQKKLAQHYNLHTRLMNHWKETIGDQILYLKNEDLIDNQKDMTAKLLDHCNLKWEDNCLEFYKTSRDVRTISLRQVRNPLNKNSLGVWKNYSNSLLELKENLKN